MTNIFIQRAYFNSILATCLFLAVSCQPESDVAVPQANTLTTQDLNLKFDAATQKIDFDKGNFSSGDIVSEVFCPGGLVPILISGNNPDFPDQNAAMIFDSSNPTGGDWDLGTPNEMFNGPGLTFNGDLVPSNNLALNNILIISEDLDSSDPDDTDVTNTSFWFDFSALGSVTMFGMDLIDVDGESVGAFVQLFDGADQELLKVDLPETGCNGVALVDLGATSEVVKMHVLLNGSGAIDNICFEKEDQGCTLTQGYWKTHALQGNAGLDPAWNLIGPLGENEPFFSSGGTYYNAINTAPAGNAYYQLSQQYVAAVLNKLNGASTSDVDDDLSDAKALFKSYTPGQIGALRGNNTTRKAFVALSQKLDSYNKGDIGPGHCTEEENSVPD